MPIETIPTDDPVEHAGSDTEEFEDAANGRRLTWLVPTLGILVALAWVGAMLWLARDSLAQLPPPALTEFVAALCVPPALIAILLLFRLRTSRAEARRFGDTAQAMRDEAASLERTISALALAIDGNRRRLAEQTSQLMLLGDGAASRLEALGDGMRRQIELAERHSRSLADVAIAAQSGLTGLLADLPRAQDEIAEAARLLDQSGHLALGHVDALGTRFVDLAEHGREADTIAHGAAQTLSAHLERMDATGHSAGQRLEHVVGDMTQAVDGLFARTAGAVEQARRGIAAQGDAMLAMTSAHQAALDHATSESVAALSERITLIEAAIARIADRLQHSSTASATLFDGLDRAIDSTDTRLGRLSESGGERTRALAASISALEGSTGAMSEALRIGDGIAGRTIATTERLLLALDAAAREIDETLPDALGRLDHRVAASRRVVSEAKPELLALVTAAEGTHDAIDGIATVIAGQRHALDQLSQTLLATLEHGRGQAGALGDTVDVAIERADRFAEEAAPRLVEALLRVRETATVAADRARETLATVIPEAAQALERSSSAALQRAAASGVEQHLAAIGSASDAAADAAERAAERLTQQMLAIADATAQVETRFDDARHEREAVAENSLTRRVSRLIDALQSASIDITRAFSADVADSAWAAYLKGDRGVFTRRAVRLLDGTDARDIANLYDGDVVVRDQINRYIHDFEAMLRQILAHGDGAAISVTLLSSDMGKLYVALAQAIERLRP